MSHGMIAAAKLRDAIVGMRKLGAFDEDVYSEMLILLQGLDRSIAEKNKKEVDIILAKIARLLYEQTCMNQETER